MGAWGTGIKDNDTSSDIYADFFDLYNAGQNPLDISKKIISENKELIDNPDDCNNFWFSLALAQWETKSLDQAIFEKIKTIINDGKDIIVWKELDADETDIQKRKIVLFKFLEKLQTEKKRPKPRQKPHVVTAVPPFDKGDCLTFKLNNGNFGGAIVLAAWIDEKYGGKNYVATTRINQKTRPQLIDFQTAEVLVINYFGYERESSQMVWFFASDFPTVEKEFELIGKISVRKKYNYGGIGTIQGSGWSNIKYCADRQFDYEKSNSRPIKQITVKDITRSEHWWKFWE